MFFPVFRCSGVPVPRCPGVPVSVFRCPGAPVFRCSGVPVFRSSGLGDLLHGGPAEEKALLPLVIEHDDGLGSFARADHFPDCP